MYTKPCWLCHRIPAEDEYEGLDSKYLTVYINSTTCSICLGRAVERANRRTDARQTEEGTRAETGDRVEQGG